MSLSAEEVMELMELNNIMNRLWSIFACSAIKGEGKLNIIKLNYYLLKWNGYDKDKAWYNMINLFYFI